MPFVQVDRGVSLFVQDWGTGKPIVFVHGWPFSHRIFEYQMTKLAEWGHRVVGIDLRGFGKSDKPWEGNDYDTWANDIGRVLRALNLRDVTLAGFSMGGAIAAHYVATRRDARITKLALLGAAAPSLAPGLDQRKVLDGYIQGVLTDQAAFAHEFVEGAFNTPISPEYGWWVHRITMSATLHACLRGLEELRDRDLTSELGAININTCIFHGIHDEIVPFSLGEEQQRLIPGSTLVRFENSGHGMFHDEKDKLVEELDDFVRGERAAAA